MQGPDEVRIETPEQIDLALEPAGLGSRLVAVVVDKQGAVELLRRLQALALPPAAAGALCPQHPWLPRAPARAGARPSAHAAWPKGQTGSGSQRRTATCLRCRA